MAQFTMHYEDDYGVAPITVNMQVNEAANLTGHFLAFVKMTDMMGFHPGSWEKVIEQAYKYCVLHEDTPENYSLFDWATDCIDDQW